MMHVYNFSLLEYIADKYRRQVNMKQNSSSVIFNSLNYAPKTVKQHVRA